MSKQNLIFNSIEIKDIRNVEDFEYAVQMTRWLLQPLGIWPMKTSTYCSSILRSLSIATCTFLLGFLLVPCCLHMFLIEKDLGVLLLNSFKIFLCTVFLVHLDTGTTEDDRPVELLSDEHLQILRSSNQGRSNQLVHHGHGHRLAHTARTRTA